MQTDDTTPPRRPSIRVNLMWAHGTEYQYRRGGCRCAMCRRGHNLAQRPWSVAHRAENYARVRQCRLDDPARFAEYLRSFLERHPGYDADRREMRAEYQRGYHAAHPDAARAHANNRRARKRNIPGTHTAADIHAQYKRQHGKCYWRKVNPECAVSLGGGYHRDHVIPLAGERTSSNAPENLVLACSRCNSSKGAKDPMDWAGVMF